MINRIIKGFRDWANCKDPIRDKIYIFFKIGREINDAYGNPCMVIGINNNNCDGMGRGPYPYPVVRYKTGFEKKLLFREIIKIMETAGI